MVTAIPLASCSLRDRAPLWQTHAVATALGVVADLLNHLNEPSDLLSSWTLLGRRVCIAAEFAITSGGNPKSAKALGRAFPPALLARADALIQRTGGGAKERSSSIGLSVNRIERRRLPSDEASPFRPRLLVGQAPQRQAELG